MVATCALSIAVLATLVSGSDLCEFPDDAPADVYGSYTGPGSEIPRFHTVFLNFNGGVLSDAGENAAENQSLIALNDHRYPVYTGGEARALSIVQAVAADYADWAIQIAYEERPPKTLPYTMVMVGGSNEDTTGQPSAGLAPLDCEDRYQRNVAFAFGNPSALAHANVISQELGHTLGLAHTEGADRIMAAGYAAGVHGDLEFGDGCTPLIAPMAGCTPTNQCHCGGVGDMQNDSAALSAIFAPASAVDDEPPGVEILEPADESRFDPGEPIHVALDVWDDFGGYGWKLVLQTEDGAIVGEQVDYDRETEFDVAGLEAGTYLVVGEAVDHAGHVGQASVRIHVGDIDPTMDPEPGDESDSSGSDDGGEAENVGDSAGGCRVASPTGGTSWAWIVGLLVLSRRRGH